MAEMTFLPIQPGNKIQYCTDVILKEAKLEDRLVKQLFYTMLSMYTSDPRNLAINSPTGEGKNYIIRKVADLFPKEDVIKFVGMTDKSLFHRSGLLVIKNERGEYEPIEQMLSKIDSDIEDKENEIHTSKDSNLKHALKAQIKELEKEKGNLYKDAKKLIDLSHKTLIFLDTPRQDLLNAIMSLLSHDEFEVEYEFVDTNNGIKTRSNILRGWPVVIFAQATDYSHYKRYSEIQRRFIVTNPKMDQQKYKAAIDLICDRYGLPDFMYQATVVNDLEKDQAREIIKGLKEKILEVSGAVEPGKSNVFIPFKEAISKSLSTKKASDMTIADRIGGYLTLLSAVNIENRPKLVLRKKGEVVLQTIPLATFEDLKETLFLMQYANGVRPYILEWYEDVFLEIYNQKASIDSKIDSKGYTLYEESIALTTQQLADATSEKQNKKLSTKQIREGYLDPLINEGYIDKQKSNLNRSADIYFPVISTTRVGKSGRNEQTSLLSEQTRIIVENSTLYPSKEYVSSKIESVLRVAFEKEYLEINKINVTELVEQYYKNPEKYFDLKTPTENATVRKDENAIKLYSAPNNDINNIQFAEERSKKSDEKTKSLPSTTFSNPIEESTWHSCHYCDYRTEDEIQYQHHIVMKHPGKPGYPGVVK